MEGSKHEYFAMKPQILENPCPQDVDYQIRVLHAMLTCAFSEITKLKDEVSKLRDKLKLEEQEVEPNFSIELLEQQEFMKKMNNK